MSTSKSSPASIPSDTKGRIVKHMNSEHQDSLVLYLEQHAGLSSYAARDATLVDASLAGLVISTSRAGGAPLHTVAFNPPLASASELRGRVVAMDQEARKALGRDAVTVRRYVAPHGVGAAFAAFAAWTLLTMTRPANFLPGSLLYDYAYKFVPWFAELNYRLASYVWWSIVVLHGLEALFVMRPKLAKHNVPVGSGVWWSWMLSDFFLDGIGSILRFDKEVADERKKREAKQH